MGAKVLKQYQEFVNKDCRLLRSVFWHVFEKLGAGFLQFNHKQLHIFIEVLSLQAVKAVSSGLLMHNLSSQVKVMLQWPISK